MPYRNDLSSPAIFNPSSARRMLEWFTSAGVATNAALFVVAAGAITFFGWKLAGAVDRLADLTGLGEAVAGALLLGAATSLPGIITSVSAAWADMPELAASNAVGGIAVQTAFLAVADLTYRRANLEHAAASAPNLIQAALLLTILALSLIPQLLPRASIWSIHPATPLIFVVYLVGIRWVAEARDSPMWHPRKTRETKEDVPDEEDDGGGKLQSVILQTLGLAAIVGIAGRLTYLSGVGILESAGLPETVVGALFTAVATSLPELVTSIAAVRRGALTLAVGGIIGGNAFDTLFLAFSDIAYRGGSLYHEISDKTQFLIVVTMLMTSILLAGLMRRERSGPANIGAESVAIATIYGCAVLATISF